MSEDRVANKTYVYKAFQDESFSSFSDLPMDSVDSRYTHSHGGAFGNDRSMFKIPEAHANWKTAAQLMVADVVGVGVLSLASAMADLGWLMGVLFIIIFFPLNMYTGLLLWRVKMQFPRAVTYLDMARSVCGPKVVVFSSVVVYLHIFLTLGDYLLIMGESLALLFYDSLLCRPYFILISCACVLPVNQLRTLNDTKWLCWINMFSITAAIAISIGVLISQGVDETRESGAITEFIPSTLSVRAFFSAFSKLAFAYAGQFLYLEIMSEMTLPSDFPKSFYLAGPYQVFMYLIVACVGYWYKGNKAAGFVVDYIPEEGVYGSLLRVAACLLFIHMIITYLVKASVISRAIHLIVAPHNVNRSGTRGQVEWLLITFSVMVLCFLIANLIPFFESLTGLIGALLVPVACWNLPVVFFVTAQTKLELDISRRESLLLGVIFIAGVVLTVVGTWSNVMNIIDLWEENGEPFDCKLPDAR